MRTKLESFLILGLGLAIAGSTSAGRASAKPLERVPQDGTLTQALQRVSDGGVVEIDDGVYAAPAGGFRIRNRSVTVRAVAGATVILDGLGIQQIFAVEDRGPDSGSYASFEGLTFANGFSTDTRRAGGVTVDAANATFVSCVFDANVAGGPAGSQARGGAVHVLNGSHARFVSSRFTDNRSGQWGAAIFAIEESKVRVNWSVFTANRTDLPEQGPVPAGGAIYVQDSELHVGGSHFEDNASGWVGGALYAIGTFGTPGASVVVESSTFVGNRAFADACCTVPGPSTGGAIHVENRVSLTVRDSRFDENFTHWGGAISSFRAAIEVHDSTFRGNRGSPPAADTPAAGGTFNLTSGDGRPASLVMTDSLVQGRFGATTTGAQQGGCIFASGALGNPSDANRAVVALDSVVLADCDVETGPEGNGRGGAIFLNVADLTLDNSIVLDSDALGENGQGGALISFGNSVVRATGTAFARNVAEERGGGIRVSGGHVEIDDCLFLDNDVTPGVAPGQPGELVQQSPGAALALGPSSDMDMTGLVANSVFTGNVGIPIVDLTSSAGTFNDVVYDGNEIRSTSFGTSVYRNGEGGFFGGFTVDELNDLSFRGISKSEVDNSLLGSMPTAGRLVAAPSRVLTTATPTDPGPTSAFLGYAWSGSSAAIDGGSNLPDSAGLSEVSEADTYRLLVGGQEVAADGVGQGSCHGEASLCLNDERFIVEVDWRSRNRIGGGTVVFGAEDSGLFWFFSEDNWELLVKVLDGCRITDHFWVFAAATTDVEYVLRVTDKVSGLSKSYFNPLDNAAAAITDTEALAACDAASAVSAWQTPAVRPAPPPAEFSVNPVLDGPPPDGKQGACSPSTTEMCLNRSRFRLEVDWRTRNGNTGSAQVAPLPVASDDSGIFFFFTEENLEMLVKVLTGCGINDRYWVFAAATTDVEYTLTVTDTETGAVKTYFNPLDNAAAAITDTEAFATCP